MFKSQYTDQLADRKADIIVRFCRGRKDGFYYEEINEVLELVDLAIKDLIVNKYHIGITLFRIIEMTTAIQKICEVASMPFIRLKTSDELKYVPKLSDFLNTFKLI